ncbi:hypothetical protein GNF82_13660 [Clostridium perfringens]
MKINQFSYKQQTGLATIFTPENEEEAAFIEKLQALIEKEEGVLSRKSFTFEENGVMSIDIDKKVTKKAKATKAAAATRVSKSNEGKKGDTSK